MNETRFKLEDAIMDCWRVVDDVRQVRQCLQKGNVQRSSNILLGIEELYTLKFEQCFATFETLWKEMHDQHHAVADAQEPAP